MLISLRDLETYLQQDVDATLGQLAIESASALVREQTGQLFDVASTTVDLSPDGANPRRLTLPQMPVRSVESVQDEDGTELADWSQRGQVLTRDCGWPCSVVVEYTHGYDAVPHVVRAVALACAARSITNSTGARSTSVDDVAVTYAGTDADLTSGAFLTDREKQMLNGLRPARPVMLQVR